MTASFRLGPDGIYRCDDFCQFLWLKHGFGTRTGNPEGAITLRQIHSAHVFGASGLADREQEGDALITGEPGKSIGVRTADCVPILLVDPEHRAVAAVHAGWRGSAAEIVKRTIEAMTRTFGTAASALHAAIGPCVRNCCYEVGENVLQQFSALFPEWGAVPEKGKLDLAEANRRQMQAVGVARDSIFDCCLCTCCHGVEFFSFRREPQNPGRMLSAICRLA